MYPSIINIINYAKICEYLATYDRAKSMIFKNGNVPTQPLPNLIYQVRKAVEMKYLADISQSIVGVNATGTITIDTIGQNGDKILVQVDDPVFGLIDLAYYTKTPTDNTIDLIATSLNSLLNANIYGYTSVASTNVVTITARPNVGAAINGKLIVKYIPTTNYLTINNIDVLMINSTDKFII